MAFEALERVLARIDAAVGANTDSVAVEALTGGDVRRRLVGEDRQPVFEHGRPARSAIRQRHESSGMMPRAESIVDQETLGLAGLTSLSGESPVAEAVAPG